MMQVQLRSGLTAVARVDLAQLPSVMMYGTCMLSLGIRDLDIVYLDPRKDPVDGDAVVFRAPPSHPKYAGVIMCKQLIFRKGRWCLQCDGTQPGTKIGAPITDEVIAGPVIARLRCTFDTP